MFYATKLNERQKTILRRIHPAMDDFDSGQGRSDLGTPSVAALIRGIPESEKAGRGRKMPFLDGHEVTS
jgi:hypothetical protein